MTTFQAIPADIAALGVHELYAYGSRVRGDADASSDLDVLAVASSPPSSLSDVVLAVRDALGANADVAVYGEERLGNLYSEGALFAWHLHAESTCLATTQPTPYLETLGPPSHYRYVQRDLESLRSILDEIEFGPSSTRVYDAGLLFVVIRNVGVLATAAIGPRPDFSHRAWVRASVTLGLCPPLPPEDYDLFRQCRRAASGSRPEQLPPDLSQVIRSVSTWLAGVESALVVSPVPSA